MSSITKLYGLIGYQFQDENLITLALTHRSMANEHNERLEFLGDSILNFVIAARLYQQFPDLREGELSRIRAGLVKGETLADIGRELTLGEFLRLGAGEKKSGGEKRCSILANTVEAIIGAVYLDAGTVACEQMVLHLYQARLADVPNTAQEKDPKTTLQEYLQGHRLPLPDYHIDKISGR